MQDVFELADDLGPLKVIHVHEPGIGLKGVLVVDNVARGPSIGGMRMAADATTGECARLARAMTFKNAAADLAHGGGKSVLIGDPKMPKAQKEILIRGFCRALEEVEQPLHVPDELREIGQLQERAVRVGAVFDADRREVGELFTELFSGVVGDGSHQHAGDIGFADRPRHVETILVRIEDFNIDRRDAAPAVDAVACSGLRELQPDPIADVPFGGDVHGCADLRRRVTGDRHYGVRCRCRGRR